MGKDKRRILVADDNKMVREMLADILACNGYSVISADDGSEAQDILHKDMNNGKGIGLVITDYEMPNLDGMELADYVRSVNQEMPIIMMSGNFDEDPELVAAAKAHGVNYCFGKPFKMIELCDLVGRILDS